MCLLIVISRLVPDWPLIVAANRDERYDRPAAALGPLRTGPPRTLGGRDLRAGGTWLAVNEQGVVAGLTNKPAAEGVPPGRRSRGAIPLEMTAAPTARSAVADFARRTRPGAFNPCWVLAGDGDSLYFVDLTRADRVEPVALGPGVYVLENKPPAQTSAKVLHVRGLLGDPQGRSGDDVWCRLVGILGDHTPALAELPGDQDRQRAARVSSCCVHTEDYGTRSSMMIRQPAGPGARPEVWSTDGPSCRTPWAQAAFQP